MAKFGRCLLVVAVAVALLVVGGGVCLFCQRPWLAAPPLGASVPAAARWLLSSKSPRARARVARSPVAAFCGASPPMALPPRSRRSRRLSGRSLKRRPRGVCLVISLGVSWMIYYCSSVLALLILLLPKAYYPSSVLSLLILWSPQLAFP